MVVEREHAFARALENPEEFPGGSAALIEVAKRWSVAVWQAASHGGPVVLAPSLVEAGVALAQRPVFVCGTHRSGTSLVRNLLDGHPQMIVLPSEGSFYTSLKPRLASLPLELRASEFAQEWARRMANPVNSPPFWLLGRSTSERSPYVEFVRLAEAWRQVLQQRLPDADGLWQLAAVALAYGSELHGDERVATARGWVEKTPTNERHLSRLWQIYPLAKAIQIVRNPEQVLLSHKALLGNRFEARHYRSILLNLCRSVVAAKRYSGSSHVEQYLLLRYDDVVLDVRAVGRTLPRFLHIEPSATLLQPTVAHHVVKPNTSFPRLMEQVHLNPMERWLVSALRPAFSLPQARTP